MFQKAGEISLFMFNLYSQSLLSPDPVFLFFFFEQPFLNLIARVSFLHVSLVLFSFYCTHTYKHIKTLAHREM